MPTASDRIYFLLSITRLERQRDAEAAAGNAVAVAALERMIAARRQHLEYDGDEGSDD